MKAPLGSAYVLPVCSLLALATCVSGCKSNKNHLDRNQDPQNSTAPVTSGRAASVSTGQFRANLVSQLTPREGQPGGGTVVTVQGQGFVSGVEVAFDGAVATDVAVISSSELTCKTPAHAAGFVDVVAKLPSGDYGTLAQAFRYDLNAGGPSAKLADTSDPSAEEQETLELINRARRDPVAEGQRLKVDFSAYKPVAPVAFNAKLAEAARKHTADMAKRSFFNHLNPDGVNANGRILDTGYALNKAFGASRTVNATENIAAGSGHALDTPEKVHNALIVDKGVPSLVHRRAILGDGPNYRSREVGLAMLTKQSGPHSNLATQEFAYTVTDRPFLLGVAFKDANTNGIADGKEGLAGLPVSLTDPQGTVLTTQTRTAGGFAFEILKDGTYTLSLDGKTTQVVIKGESVKVDLRDGVVTPY